MYIAIITGASSGMGRKCGEILADKLRKADEIWLIARRERAMTELAHSLPESKREKIRIIEGDLTEDAAFERISEMLSEKKPKILFLVNAAGFGKIGRTEELCEKIQSDMIRLNVEALVRLTRICLPYMADRVGRIINFASAAAFLPQPGFAVYAASKSFVLSFSEALNYELRHREISVTAVCPGPVKTEFFDLAEEFEEIALYKKLVMAKPEKVVKKALRDSVRRRPVSVYGISMKGLRIISRILPHRLVFKVMSAADKKDRRQ